MREKTGGHAVLVVDDDEDTARVIEANLAIEGFEVATASSGSEAITRARLERPDCIVLDVMMPELDGLQVCQAIREDPRTNSTAVIMVTAKATQDDRLAGLAVGADDYVAKPFDPRELVYRVRAALRRRQQMREVSPLTGLPGNFAIRRELEIRVAETPQHFAVMHADLDNFKAFNDYYGFMRGDGAIQLTADVIQGAAAAFPGNFVGHLGGDDFVIVCRPGEAETICGSITRTFAERVGALYDDDDRQRGYIEITDRQGNLRRFPMLSVSVGVAHTARRRFTSSVEASAVATEMKNVAKKREGNSCEIDRRGGDLELDLTKQAQRDADSLYHAIGGFTDAIRDTLATNLEPLQAVMMEQRAQIEELRRLMMEMSVRLEVLERSGEPRWTPPKTL